MGSCFTKLTRPTGVASVAEKEKTGRETQTESDEFKM